MTTIIRDGQNGGSSRTYVLCNGSKYAQTLFLGCSVKSYNSSLAWTGESSRLTVEIIEDSCEYPYFTDGAGNPVTRPATNSTNNDYLVSRAADSFQKDSDGNSLIPGKVYYVPYGSSLISRYHYGADPGFYGNDIDILGSAVYFKFDNFEFNGVVQSYSNNGGAGGTKIWTVIIESPTHLLNQTNLILDSYSGTVFRIYNNGTRDSYGFPGYARNTAGESYQGLIAEGNTPNVINVYGYLEALGLSQAIPVLYGYSGRNSEGIPANNVITAVDALLSSSSPNNNIYKFSPFARIIGRMPTLKSNGSVITSSYDMGLIYPQQDGYGQYRLGYRVDLSALSDIEISSLLSYMRISQSTMSLQDFISSVCSSTGRQFFIGLSLSISSGLIAPVITVNTVSTLSQTYDGAVDSFISYAASLGTSVIEYSKGKSYNSSDPVRTMIIGGKQQRLYQVKLTKYALKQSTLRYNSITGGFVTIDHQTKYSYYRYPDITSTRNPSYYTNYDSGKTYYGRVELPNSTNFNTSDADWEGTGSSIYGNFSATQKVAGSIGQVLNALYAASDTDAICPYFGTNNITGAVRKVYRRAEGLDPVSSQPIDADYLVQFTNTEIGLGIGYSFATPSTVNVSETEIRAAMQGPDSFAGFISAVIKDYTKINGSSSGCLDLWDKIIYPILGNGAFKLMVNGISENYNKYNNSRHGHGSIPMGREANYNANPVVLDVLTKLQNFLGDIGNTYYGKQFMVSVPTPAYWTDAREFSPQIQVGVDSNNDPLYLLDGTLETYYSYEPTDFAWEEPGNIIDDHLYVGSASMDSLTQDNGSIEPIIGYNYTYQFNYQKAYGKNWWTANAAGNSNYNEWFNFWKHDAYLKAGLSFAGGSSALSSFYEPSLSITPDNNQYVVGVGSTVPDAFGTYNIPGYKLYTKATVEKNIVPYYVGGALTAKVIVKSEGIHLNPVYPEALNVTTAAVEFLASKYTGVSASVGKKILSLIPLFNNNSTPSPFAQDFGNKQYNNISIAPKAAMPAFVGVPIQFNNSVYGPWVSTPDRAANTIFSNNAVTRLENLVGGTKVEVNEGLVPWNYGGMRVLDEAALQLVGSENNYNITTEEGQLVTYGLPLLKLGDELKAAADTFNGPTISNVQVQISEQGPTTTYTFRTFTRKFSLFNKENADKLQNSARTTIKLNRDINQKVRNVAAKMLALSSSPTVNNFNYKTSKLNEYSPMGILVGYSYPYISPKASGSPGRFKYGSWTRDSLKQNSIVTLQDARELPQEFDSQYASKAIMSLDGLLSPVSFYPTLNGSTTAFKKYITAYCPVCNGTKAYTESGISKYCDSCESSSSIINSTGSLDKYNSSSVYLLSSQADTGTIRDLTKMSGLIEQMRRKQISYVDLNPFIMPTGELRNRFAQSGDYNAHQIDVVGRSLVPMKGSLSFNDNLALDDSGYLDQNASSSNLDWNSYQFDLENGRTPSSHLMNYRFLGLKGPLVINGWGYDIEGFPVPNSSGDPKSIDASGNPLKIASKTDSTGSYNPSFSGTILGKNQTWVPGTGWTDAYKENTFASGWGLRPDTWVAGPVDLRWNQERKVWSSPQPKFVSVKLEDDLKPNFAARGYLNVVDSGSPLPSGEKRLVFVKDSTASYGAPSGAKILCYYDESLGYYEPISRNNISTSGMIYDISMQENRTPFLNGSQYRVAKTGIVLLIDSYSRDIPYRHSAYSGYISGVFNNPLGFGLIPGQMGMFTYIRNEWVVSSVNNTSALMCKTTGIWNKGTYQRLPLSRYDNMYYNCSFGDSCAIKLPPNTGFFNSNTSGYIPDNWLGKQFYMYAYNNYANIGSGKWCSISHHQDGNYYLIAAEC
jgi:hypothetical protein